MLKTGTPEDSGMDPERIAALRERAFHWCDGHRMRTGVLLAARHGKIVFHEAYGPLSDLPSAPMIKTDTIFRIASVTKPITATLAMILVEEGRLGLNRPLAEYLPELQGDGTEDIEVQHLFTHTSGYDEDEVESVYVEAVKNQLDDPSKFEEQLNQSGDVYFKALWSLKASGKPGSAMSYADHNFNLLGEIVRRVSGQTLNSFAEEKLFAPLGMDDTSFTQNQEKSSRCTFYSSASIPISEEWGAHGLNTTALDLARFGQLFLNLGKWEGRQILSQATVREMTRNQIPGIGTSFFGKDHPEASWGLGWAVQDDVRWTWSCGTLTPKGTFAHIGAGGHCIWVDRENDIVGVYLSACMELDQETMTHHWHLDLFQNMVTASVVD
jgi:CubicO group peptidase (beta-lactamase class C family)